MKMVYLVIFLGLLCFSCSTRDDLKQMKNSDGLKRRNVKDYYLANGLTSYFLPQLPIWANFSEKASCHRDTSIRYIDLKKMMSSFSLSYEEVIQMQLMYNDELHRLKRKKHIDLVSLKDEEKLFYEVSQKIQQGLRTFRVPSYVRLNIIWLDVFTSSRLKEIMNSREMATGHPVFLSFCMSRQKMMDYLKRNNLSEKNIRLISSELMSAFGHDKKLNSYFSLDLGKLIPKKKKVYLYTTKKRRKPHYLKGQFKTKYL